MPMNLDPVLTIGGLYNYDNTIFANLHLPAATGDLPAADTTTAIFEILENCSDFEIMYPDADYMKLSIGYWSTSMQIPWARIWAAIHEEYDPLHNYDRYEDTHEETSGDNTQTLNTTETGAKTGYNSDTFQNTDKTTQGGTVGNEGSGERDLDTHVYGNIGVTTSQQMLKAELDIATELDFYKMVARQFAEKFCVMLY